MRKDLGILLTLALGLAACWAPGLDAPRHYDDDVYVYHNPRLQDDGLLLKAFTEPTPRVLRGTQLNYLYRPLSEAGLRLNHLVAGNDERSLRTGSLLIHAASAVLVLLWIRRLAPAAAPWAALLVGLHPLAVQATTYLSQRATAQEGFFALLCVALYLAARAGKGPLRYGMALAAGLAAMLSKESALTIPLTLAAAEWILRDPAEPWPRILRRWLPFVLLTAPVVLQALRGGMAGWAQADAGYTRRDYLLIQREVVLHYLRLAAAPFSLHFPYDPVCPWPHPDPLRFPLLPAILRTSALAALGAWLLLGARRHRLPRLAAALYLAPLALECTVFPLRDVAASHRCYPGLAGAGLLFGLLAAQTTRARRALPVLALLGMGALTAGENSAWASSLRMARRDVRHAYHVGKWWGTYALERLHRNEPERAEPLSRQGVRNAFSSPPWQARFRSLQALGREEEARAEAERLLELRPDQDYAIQISRQVAEQARDEEALDHLADLAQALADPEVDTALWLTRHRASQGRLGEAMEALRRIQPRAEHVPGFWDHLGYTLLLEGRWSGAEAAYLRGLALDPSMAKAWYHLGEARRHLGRPSEAAEAYRAALNLQPGYAKAGKALYDLNAPDPRDPPDPPDPKRRIP